jgi:RNA polymerase sigma-70 factor (ECF subfamily)
MDARATIDQVVRASYGRLVAFLAARSRDVAAAEDALAEAFQAALVNWPKTGVPEKPEAWLLVTARRRLIDAARHARVQAEAVPSLLAAADEAQEMTESDLAFPDERLKLLFVCAHPAIDPNVHTPLMLQTVLGLDAARIAAAFLVQPAAMGQRLTRAKAKIRDARVAFELPCAAELPQRLDAVLGAIYAAYGTGWEDIKGADRRHDSLAQEAIELGRVLLQMMPNEPEVKGLLALMLHCAARFAARRSANGKYVPLTEQDTALWSRPLIAEAEELLWAAERTGRIGRYQLEAAIQSAHAERAWTGRTDWEAIALLYEGLVGLAPGIGALVSRAAAVAEARGAAMAWPLLQMIPAEAVASYQPYWALTAHLLKRMGQTTQSADAYRRAVGLSEDSALRAFLTAQMPPTASDQNAL